MTFILVSFSKVAMVLYNSHVFYDSNLKYVAANIDMCQACWYCQASKTLISQKSQRLYEVLLNIPSEVVLFI